MKPDYAFEFKDLAVLLALELTEPTDHVAAGPTPPSLRSTETGTGQRTTWFGPYRGHQPPPVVASPRCP
jgi:hypothetical protein